MKFKFKFKLKALLSAGILSSVSFASHALVLDAIDRGAYSDSGFHTSINTNYITGDLRNGPPFYTDTHNFFVFDLSSVLGTITSAKLHLFNPANNPATTVNESGLLSTARTPETYQVNHVTTPITALVAGGFTEVATFVDLGDGVAYGSYVASNADNGQFIDIVLNAAALADLNAAIGGQFALGGSLTSLNAVADTEALFRFTNAGIMSDTQLILTTAEIPEPASLALLGIGLVGLSAARRRKSNLV